MPVADKKEAHDLIEQLQPEQIPAVVSWLKSRLQIEIDDEPETEEERKAIAEADAWLKAHGGRGIPMEEVLAEYGLTMADFPPKDHGSNSDD